MEYFDLETRVKRRVLKEDKTWLVKMMKILNNLPLTLIHISLSLPSPPPLFLVLSHLISAVPRNSYSLSLNYGKSLCMKIFLFKFYEKQYIRPNQNRII